MQIVFFILLILIAIILIQHFLDKALIGQKKKYSIALYEGEDLFNLKPKIAPILTKFDVSDVKASFVADPFLIKYSDKYYLFMEVKSKRKRDIGEIGVAIGDSTENIKYQKIVLKEPFHLSYPNVLFENEKIYMIPESGENRDLRLYEAVNFPFEWKLKKVILKGKKFADASFIFYNKLWWMFVSDIEDNSLHIYYSKSLLSEFTPHKQNPIYVNNKEKFRNGGNPVILDGKMYRFVQNCKNYYGEKLDVYEIKKLNQDEFEEKFIKTLFSPSKKGWNSDQMHHISLLKEKDKIIAAVDGGSFEKENYYEIKKFLRKLF